MESRQTAKTEYANCILPKWLGLLIKLHSGYYFNIWLLFEQSVEWEEWGSCLKAMQDFLSGDEADTDVDDADKTITHSLSQCYWFT